MRSAGEVTRAGAVWWSEVGRLVHWRVEREEMCRVIERDVAVWKAVSSLRRGCTDQTSHT